MTTDSEKERQLLEAAALIFQDRDYDIFSEITYRRIADKSGWSERSVRDYFEKPQLRRKLVEYMTDPARVALNVNVDMISTLLNNGEQPLLEAFLAIGSHYVDNVYADMESATVRSTLALWPYARRPGFSGGDEFLRQRLADAEETLDKSIEAAMNAWFVHHSSMFRPRLDFLTVRELSTLLLAVTQGLAVRLTLDPEVADAELLGKAYAILSSAMIVFHDDPDETESNLPVLAELDRRRREAN